MAREKILVVDDEEDILELLRYNLSKDGYEVSCAATGEACLEAVESNSYDLILLDLMLPGIDGLQVCKSLKSSPKAAQTPVIMLTAKGEEADIVTGLELGADDYITKPFSPRILLARVRAVLRREVPASNDENGLLEAESLKIDVRRHEALLDGSAIDLTSTEFKTLHFLARNRGWVFTRSQIIEAVHGDDYPVTDRSVDVQIVGLRKKLGDCGEYIETVRGVGYRFRE